MKKGDKVRIVYVSPGNPKQMRDMIGSIQTISNMQHWGGILLEWCPYFWREDFLELAYPLDSLNLTEEEKAVLEELNGEGPEGLSKPLTGSRSKVKSNPTQ